MKRDAHYPQSGRPAPVKGHWLAFAVLSTSMGLASCATVPAQKPEATAPAPPQVNALGNDDNGEPVLLRGRANEVLIRAIGLVGTPYRYGGNTPEGGFDCSGLVAHVFREATGLQLPRSTREQIDFPARTVDRDDLQAGDLVFFSTRGNRANHIGIYVGEGRFVHAPSTGGTVRLDALATAYWQRSFVSGKRLLD